MLLKELVEKIQSLDGFSEKDKKACLNLITHLNKAQLQELASLVFWYEEQEKNLHRQEKGILNKVKMLFTKMNRYAAKMGGKLYFKQMEEQETKKNLRDLDALLNQL
jgi:hypothetical protein